MKRPRDPNQLAKMILDIATGEAGDTVSEKKRNPQAIRGRIGGLKGGPARSEKLSAAERHGIAVKAAHARWKGRAEHKKP